jgi:hypothetical protein
MTTVYEKHRIREDHWVFGCCERCGSSPHEVRMVREAMVPGGPKSPNSNNSVDPPIEMWVCPKCGYTKSL